MKPLASEDITGNWATVLLTFNEDDSIDYTLLKEQIDVLIESGVNGVYCNGTTTEFYNQTEEEFDTIAALLAEKCAAANTPFQIGVSHMSPILSLNRLLRTKALKPGAFQIILPDWFPTTFDDRVAFLKKMADAADGIGLVLYNPKWAKVTLNPEEIAVLVKEIPEIVGVKGLWDKKTRALCPDLSIFVPGHYLATFISEGASGSYSNVACLNPAAAQCWYEMMLTDSSSALKLEQRIQSFMSDHIRPFISEQGYSNHAVDKYMACVGGWTEISSRLRWPYKSIPASEVARLRPIAKNLLPEFF